VNANSLPTTKCRAASASSLSANAEPEASRATITIVYRAIIPISLYVHDLEPLHDLKTLHQ
jgi:hypothetical protein